jgi:hypothetical protein
MERSSTADGLQVHYSRWRTSGLFYSSWLLSRPLCSHGLLRELGLRPPSYVCHFYLYLIAPVLFNDVFGVGHEFKVQPSGGFHWGGWAIVGVLTLAATMYVCVRNLAVPDTV